MFLRASHKGAKELVVGTHGSCVLNSTPNQPPNPSSSKTSSPPPPLIPQATPASPTDTFYYFNGSVLGTDIAK